MTGTTLERREEIAAFSGAHADRLRRSVASRIRAPHELVDDACATAWTILLRRPDIRLHDGGYPWLVVVAVNEALALLRARRREEPTGAFLPVVDDGERSEPAHDGRDVVDQVADHILHAERLAAMYDLKPRDRDALFLKGAGYSYKEIQAITAASDTAVNRRITEGRARVRQRVEQRREEAATPPATSGSRRSIRSFAAARCDTPSTPR